MGGRRKTKGKDGDNVFTSGSGGASGSRPGSGGGSGARLGIKDDIRSDLKRQKTVAAKAAPRRSIFVGLTSSHAKKVNFADGLDLSAEKDVSSDRIDESDDEI